MRSLRLRFFLISWPLVVAAIAVVAFSIERWTVVQMEHVELGPRVAVSTGPHDAWADALGAAWSELPTQAGQAHATRLAASADPPVDLVVLAASGLRVFTTDPAIQPAPGGRDADGVTRLLRSERTADGVTAESEFVVAGIPVRDPGGRTLGELFVLPTRPEPRAIAEAPPAAWHSSLRRTLWATALVASLAAAAAALLLAGPLVRQVQALTKAAAAIREGALAVRVPTHGNDELARLGRSFNDMAVALERADAHKRNLVTDVAHELRTPLTNIVGLIEAMQDGLRAPDAATLASLRAEAGLLAALVDELQELSLAESGQLALDLQAVDAAAAARAAVEAIRPVNSAVDIRGPEAVGPVLVRADARRLAQVLRNLLRNALTHTPAGGRVTVEVAARGERVEILVVDTGCGIPEAQLPLIWERFHRVDASRDRHTGGMGIGLALVRQLVLAMGGEVGVESELGRGARFRIALPAAVSAVPAGRAG